MADNARGTSDRLKNQEMAAYMKRQGITRTTGRCPICYSIISIPTDRHFYGTVCVSKRKGI